VELIPAIVPTRHHVVKLGWECRLIAGQTLLSLLGPFHILYAKACGLNPKELVHGAGLQEGVGELLEHWKPLFEDS
jgi:hypothetical protein